MSTAQTEIRAAGPAAAPPPARSPLETLFTTNPAAVAALRATLWRTAARWVPRSAIDDVLGQTFVVAMVRERNGKGKHWDPACDLGAHMSGILGGVLANRRRGLRRRPTSQLGEDEDIAAPDADAESQLLAVDAEAELDEAAAALEAALLRESQNGLSPRVYAALRSGLRGHPEIARHLGCAPKEIGLAMRRIAHHCKRLRARFGGSKGGAT